MARHTSPWWWFALVLAGTVVRFFFGLKYELWNGAADQLAWGIGLDDMPSPSTASISKMIHYPHEGGTLALSLLSMLLRPLSGIMPALSWASLLVDALSRFLSIRVAQRLFGDRTAWWFAGWTVLAAPLMLPWATIDCGLHALISFAPIVLVGLSSRPDASPWTVGLACGLFACLAYDVWVFAPAFVVWWLLHENAVMDRLKGVLRFAAGCAIGFLPHIVLRLFADNGFGLEDPSFFSVRGLEKAPFDPLVIPERWWTVWVFNLPGSFQLDAQIDPTARRISLLVLAFILAGIVGALLRRGAVRPTLRLLLLVVFSFTFILAAGPFFSYVPEGRGYLYNRYFPFIAPLLVLGMIAGFEAFRSAGPWLRGMWMAGCAAGALEYMATMQHYSSPNDPAIGWVIGRKYGDDPDRLMRLLNVVPVPRRKDVLYGYGWGIAASLFDGADIDDRQLLDRFDAVWRGFPESVRPRVAEGVIRAFEPGITPDLDDALGAQLAERMRLK